MYTPKPFQMPEEQYADFILKHPLAILIATDGRFSAHCPLVYLPETHQLVGHLAKGNCLLEALSSDKNIKVLFTGNHGYISASWYIDDQEVPTWNYSSLEVTGIVTLANNDVALKILTILTQQFEATVDGDWTMDKLADDRRTAMLKGIQAFSIDIKGWQGKAKLSQNKTPKVRKRLLSNISQQDNLNYQYLSGDMTHD